MKTDKFENGMEFYTEPFEINPEDKLTVFRFNVDNTSPYAESDVGFLFVWDQEAKAVKTSSGAGIYGFIHEGLYFSDIFFRLHDIVFSKSKGEVNIIKLEVDKKHLLFYSPDEIAFTQCNVIKWMKIEEFFQLLPAYKSLINSFQLAIDTPTDANKAYFTHCFDEANRNMTQIWLTKRNSYSQNPVLGLNLDCVKNFALCRYKTSEIHGLSHWQRVERNGILLAEKTGAKLGVVRLFAYVHDMCRENDGHDPEHGLRAARLIEHYKYPLFIWFTDDEIDRLKFACTNHSTLLRSGDPTIDACFDAERLDLARRGIVLNPELMATEKGATFAADPELFKKAVDRFNISRCSNRANDLEHWGIFATQLA